jgi:hypothetical protein
MVRTQHALPSEEAVLFLLFGLLRSGQVRLRRLVGWQDLTPSQTDSRRRSGVLRRAARIPPGSLHSSTVGFAYFLLMPIIQPSASPSNLDHEL